MYEYKSILGAYKVDQKYHPPAINTIAKLAKNALSNANVVRYTPSHAHQLRSLTVTSVHI